MMKMSKMTRCHCVDTVL